MKVKIINSQEYKFIIVPQFERYYSEDTHYGVYTFLTEDDIPKYTDYKDQLFLDDKEETTPKRMSLLCGNMQRLYVGSEYEVTTTVEYNTKYKSWQYIPKIVTAVIPQTADQQKKFLESLLTQKQAEVLLKEYPNVVEDVINNRDNVEIDKLYGIGKTTWESIRERIINNYIISDILILLQPLGVSFNMIKKLISEEPNPALLKQKLIDNPYIMTKIKGFGFKTVDTLALKLNPNIRLSKQRTYAFITYYLKDVGENVGHTWVRENILESAVIDNINECIDIYHDIIKLEKQKNAILYFNDNKVGLAKYHELESNIFNILVSLNNYNKSFEVDIEDGIQEAEKEQGFQFSDEQNRIIEKAFENNVTVISGRAGTGKTSISRAILKIYNNANYRIGACALSAKAAQRITEATGFPASTIHRMLSWQGEEGFTYNHFNPLPYDVILLDEASMVNVPIFYALLSAIREGSRVIICGDDKQLPPIGYGNVFGDLIQKTDVFNVNQLTHVHRQAEKSGILSDANKIREGVYPIKQPELKIVSGELKDMVYMFRDSREALRNLAIKTYLKSIQEDGIDNVVIITPRKQNCINSTAEINRLIQNALISKDTEYMKYGDKIFKLGAKVIQRENNYDKNVFNGEIGYITKIWNEGKITKFRIDYKMNNETKTIDYTKNELDQIDLAYAMTVHLCVPKDTYIYTNKGLIEIDKLNNTKNEFEYNPIKSDIKVFNGYNLEQPSYFYNAGESICKTIKIERGFELTATLDHGVNVINQNFEIIRKDMNELTTNDFVLLRYGQNIFGNIKEIPKQYFNIEVDVRANKYNLPKVLTKDFARFLGYIVADGTIYEKGFRYSKRDLSTVQDFKRVTDSIFGTNYNIIPQHNKYEYTINSTQISKFLFNIGGMCPHNKYVPDIILQSSKEMQCEFLKSVFEDGTVNIKNGVFDHVELVMINKKMQKQIALMLLNIGIKTTLYTTTKKTKNGTDTIYHIYIYKQDAILFEKYIGFICDRKNNNLHLCNQKTYCCPCKSFPYLKEILICIAKKYNLPLQKAGVYKLTNNITYNMFNRFYNSNDVLKQDDKMNNIKNIIEKFDIQQIVNITSSIQNTVCITMPQTHQFIQDGFYGWNCQGSGFKTVIVIIDNTHYTLLDTCLLYTAITRAKKRCLLVAEPSAFKKCIDTNKSINRQTWLKDMN